MSKFNDDLNTRLNVICNDADQLVSNFGDIPGLIREVRQSLTALDVDTDDSQYVLTALEQMEVSFNEKQILLESFAISNKVRAIQNLMRQGEMKRAVGDWSVQFSESILVNILSSTAGVFEKNCAQYEYSFEKMSELSPSFKNSMDALREHIFDVESEATSLQQKISRESKEVFIP